ncbi:hypothetical protein [Arcticibacter tournemirensis]
MLRYVRLTHEQAVAMFQTITTRNGPVRTRRHQYVLECTGATKRIDVAVAER